MNIIELLNEFIDTQKKILIEYNNLGRRDRQEFIYWLPQYSNHFDTLSEIYIEIRHNETDPVLKCESRVAEEKIKLVQYLTDMIKKCCTNADIKYDFVINNIDEIEHIFCKKYRIKQKTSAYSHPVDLYRNLWDELTIKQYRNKNNNTIYNQIINILQAM